MSHRKPKSISIQEIAKRTGFSVRQMQRLAKAGEMPSVEQSADGYHRRYLLTPELEEWIKSQRRRLKGRQKRQGGKPVIEKHDGGTPTFGGAINDVVVLNGMFERAGKYDEMSAEQLFELHADMFPMVKVWNQIVRRFTAMDGLSKASAEEFRQQLKELSI